MKFQTKTIVYTALMTSIVTVSTAFLGINMGTTYTNLGDTAIFVTATLLGPVPAMIAGGLGSFFADAIVFPITMWFTLLIKGIEGLICGLIFSALKKLPNKKLLPLFALISMIIASLWMIFGYFIAESLLYGTLAAAVFALSANAVQASLSIALAMILIFSMKLIKMGIDLQINKK